LGLGEGCEEEETAFQPVAGTGCTFGFPLIALVLSATFRADEGVRPHSNFPPTTLRASRPCLAMFSPHTGTKIPVTSSFLPLVLSVKSTDMVFELVPASLPLDLECEYLIASAKCRRFAEEQEAR
jgi:hypothetical protein